MEVNVNRFERALGELRKESPVSGIERCLHGQPANPRIAWWLAAGAASGVAVVALVAMPTPAHAGLLSQVRDAMGRVRHVHLRSYMVGLPEAKYPEMEAWVSGKHFRYDSLDVHDGKPVFQSVFDGKRHTTYIVTEKLATVRSKPPIGAWSSMTLPELAKQLGKAQTVKIEEVTEEGRPMLRLTSDGHWMTGGKTYASRTVYLADPIDKLPRQMLNFDPGHSEDGRPPHWQLRNKVELDYPSAVPEDRFKVDLPADVDVIDKDREMAGYRSRWAKGIQIRNGLTLRDVILDRVGLLHVIWTGGPALQPSTHLWILDAAGHRFSGYPYPPHPEIAKTKFQGSPARIITAVASSRSLVFPIKIVVPGATFRVSSAHRTDESREIPALMGAVPR
ncbi:hypothetical protein OP10G_2599 [Fimbriimonas ginsengisoli Gsoil 348]|uniref:Uncharacterized protein n=1 Tax=Fimbriimonas ginsengisoli Gsoil 348 TaxID=661478 RepID=A0A068NRG6_FIMGI|nr:hypothetical protein OP10G_2599 [Fimbriimonas ginsengisoli Gsoil 348]